MRVFVVLAVDPDGEGAEAALRDLQAAPGGIFLLAERHGGIVEVDSTLGKGSCFSIYLPHGGKSACERMQQLENPIPTKM